MNPLVARPGGSMTLAPTARSGGLLLPECDGLADRNRGEYQMHGNDADYDRSASHPRRRADEPDHYWRWPFDYRTPNARWSPDIAVGKTAVAARSSTGVVGGLGRKLIVVRWVQVVRRRVGHRTIGFGGEVSAGARSCAPTAAPGPPTRTASTWPCWPRRCWPSPQTPRSATPSSRELRAPTYARIDAPADREQKARLAKLSAEQVSATELAVRADHREVTTAPAMVPPRRAKVTTENAWIPAGRRAPRTSTRSTPVLSGSGHLARCRGRQGRGQYSHRVALVRWTTVRSPPSASCRARSGYWSRQTSRSRWGTRGGPGAPQYADFG